MSKIFKYVNEDIKSLLPDEEELEIEINKLNKNIESYDNILKDIDIVKSVIENEKMILRSGVVTKEFVAMSCKSTSMITGSLEDSYNLNSFNLTKTLEISIEEKNDWVSKTVEVAKKIFIKINREIRKIILKLIGYVQMFKKKFEALKEASLEIPDSEWNNDDFSEQRKEIFLNEYFGTGTVMFMDSDLINATTIAVKTLKEAINRDFSRKFVESYVEIMESSDSKYKTANSIRNRFPVTAVIGNAFEAMVDNNIKQYNNAIKEGVGSVDIIRFDNKNIKFVFIGFLKESKFVYEYISGEVRLPKLNKGLVIKAGSKSDFHYMLDYACEKANNLKDIVNNAFKDIDTYEKIYTESVNYKNSFSDFEKLSQVLKNSIKDQILLTSKIYTTSPKIAFDRVLNVYSMFRNIIKLSDLILENQNLKV